MRQPRQAGTRRTRREFLGSIGGGTAAAWAATTEWAPGAAPAADAPASREGAPPAGKPGKVPIPLIHESDLFRPYGDPDDHFDLACVYALAWRGDVDLRGVLGDYPPARRQGDPDIASVAMLNYLTGQAAPLVVGMSAAPAGRRDRMESAAPADLAGVAWLLKTLRDSPQPVAITIIGSARDVAVAARREPDLFKAKCRAVYLNSGSGTPDVKLQEKLEYNVGLDVASYAAMFDLPCPLVWLPCFDHLVAGQGDPYVVRRYGTFWKFQMGDVLNHLSPPMQRFFLSMLDKEEGTHWLKSLKTPVDSAKLASWGGKGRNMWSTAGFLHLAGLTATVEGTLAPLDRPDVRAPYRFVPVRVECDDGGRTKWQDGPATPPRWKFEVTDLDRYASAMTGAMRELLAPLGRRAG